VRFTSIFGYSYLHPLALECTVAAEEVEQHQNCFEPNNSRESPSQGRLVEVGEQRRDSDYRGYSFEQILVLVPLALIKATL